VAESGSGKSPAQKTILKPLFRLQAEAEEVYRVALEIWEDECQRFKEAGHGTSKKPKPRDYFTTDATREAVVQIQANQPNCGFLGWFDELSALIRGQNQYRNGRGTDKESLLSGRDGSAQKVDRAGGKRLFIARSAYSITGSTQPDTLRSLMGDFSDPTGQWARFLWCFLPIRPAPYPEQAVRLDVSNLLEGIYRRLAEFPAMTYRLSPGAKNHYIHWYNELDRLRLQEVKQSLRAVYAKFKSDTGVLVLLLHCLNAAISGQLPAEQVAEATMQSAIQLSKFYLGQVKLIHSEGDALDHDLTPSYCKILSLSQRKGWVTARDIYRARAVGDRKATLNQIRGLMRELVTMGLAQARNQGNRLEIRAFNPGDTHPNTDDNPPKSGDNPSEFGDSLLNAGDNWTTERDKRELASIRHSVNRTFTSDNPNVTKNGAVVTTLSPGWQSRKALPNQGSTPNKVEFVTTEQHQPFKARPPNFVKSTIQVGDVCRYRDPDGAMKVTCWGKDLQVVAIEKDIATVKANQWVHSYQVEMRYLRKLR
jgi:CRISPR-associated protein Cmr3